MDLLRTHQLIDISGRIISKGTWLNNQKSQFLNISKIQSGVYLIKVQIGELSVTQKILIIK